MRLFARRFDGGTATKLPRPGLAVDEPLFGEPADGMAGRHPADPELAAEVGVGRAAGHPA